MAKTEGTWWQRLAQKDRKWAPVDNRPVPDHKAHFVSRGGVPDLCCELHRLFPRDDSYGQH